MPSLREQGEREAPPAEGSGDGPLRLSRQTLLGRQCLWQRHNVTASDRLRGLITLPLSSNVGWRIAVFVPDGRLRVFCVTEKARI